MHVFTVNKKAIQKAALIVCCAVLLVVSVFTIGSVITGRTTQTSGKPTTVENTGEMVSYLMGYGLEVDVTTARLENGRIPKKFDESFVAFNEVIIEGGGDLAGYKNKKIEKWSFTIPALSSGDETANAVLIVYKGKVIGSYILMQPSGEVLAITAANAQQQTPAGEDISGVLEVE
ncbi:DUF4830 domain-containing protein [Ruminococcaceae bacterium OttesenSCG-928-N02]|nr:DUF4830 domain-containing protein [Ruminococcaceae bacterium OttesenSCG-928-N02]